MIKLVCNILIILIFSLFVFTSCKKEDEILKPTVKKSTETSDDISTFDIETYEIGGEQERLKVALTKPYSEWDGDNRIMILFHKKGEDDYTYFIQGTDGMDSECYKSYVIGLYPSYKIEGEKSTFKEYKPYFCLQIGTQRYGKKMTFDDLKADLQALYNKEILQCSNPIISTFYPWHFYPYEETNRPELTAQTHLYLRERDFIGINSHQITVFDFFPENKTKIDNFVKYIEDKYYDKITKGIDFDNPNLPADPDRYKVLYWPDPDGIISGKFKDE